MAISAAIARYCAKLPVAEVTSPTTIPAVKDAATTATDNATYRIYRRRMLLSPLLTVSSRLTELILHRREFPVEAMGQPPIKA